MNNVGTFFGLFARPKLGRCIYCMRTSFKFAVAGWIGVALIAAFVGWQPLLIPAFMAAVGLTILWLAHLVAFALRSVNRGRDRAAIAPNFSDTFLGASLPRREVMPLFLRAFVAAGAATALPAIAFAQSSNPNYNQQEATSCAQQGGAYTCCGDNPCFCCLSNACPAC